MGALKGEGRRTPLGAALLVTAAAAAAAAPLLRGTEAARQATSQAFPGWPAELDGRALLQLELTPREAGFLRDFPGRVGRFSDGRSEIIVRWVASPTRQLHPAAECLKAIGFAIAPRPASLTAGGAVMGCFRASRGSEAIDVCERIEDGLGQSWPDVSAWYWHALAGSTAGPWWSYVIAGAPEP